MVASHPLAGKTGRALLVMFLLLALPYSSSRLRALRVARAPWDPAEDVALTPSETSPLPGQGEAELRGSENRATVSNALPASSSARAEIDPRVLARAAGSLAIEDPSGHALDAFFAQLARTEKKEPGAMTRVLHYGDSVITGDLVSGTMRRLLQARFGDGGHGFILTANPWEWYFHNDVRHGASDGWNAHRITGPWSNDGGYGLGGVSFHTSGQATAWFGTTEKGDFGRKVGRFDVFYLEQPAGGDVDLTVTGSPPQRLTTRGPRKVSRVLSLAVADGAAELKIRTRGSGDVRIFGVALEREEPAVVYDALGINGCRARLWEQMNDAHWKEQMDLRKPSLVVLHYGTNESEAGVVDPSYRQQLGSLIDRVKTAAPGASVLVVAPMDRAEKSGHGELRSRKVIVELVALQREIAHAHGVAFWDTFQAMGGEGSMARWVKASPQLASWDLTHPTPAGAEVIGGLLEKAVLAGYEAYRGPRR